MSCHHGCHLRKSYLHGWERKNGLRKSYRHGWEWEGVELGREGVVTEERDEELERDGVLP